MHTETKRILRAAHIADLIESGWRPGPRELQNAATINDYCVCQIAGSEELVVIGSVTDHESVPNGRKNRLMRTSVLIAADVEAGWFRTLNTWYLFGTPKLAPSPSPSLGI